ncbi:MAG: RNA methyltransferase [Bacteroidetes bacterium]|nr:MAG: RNA methyltransferase [Bacteroidota bacterium]TAG86803.1 MAG: RNA methyltransferase [Bacteroidota bacterium]
MISKNKIKYLKSLQQKKIRKEEKCFLAEGEKIVVEILQSDAIVTELYATDIFINKYEKLIQQKNVNVLETNHLDLEQIGYLQTNHFASILMPFLPEKKIISTQKTLTIVLDNIQDAGNFGTIIRIADWFGVQGIVCSLDTVDVYNSKVLGASMASFLRVPIVYQPLRAFFEQNKDISVFGAMLDGENLYHKQAKINGVLIMGNESKGISKEISHFITHKIMIPRFGEAESLNVGIATAIFCNHWRENQ